MTTTTMETALVKAGLPVPSKLYRTWRWVADHRDCTSADVAAALGIPKGETAANLAQLKGRGMLDSKAAMERDKRVHRYFSLVKEYGSVQSYAKGKKSRKPASAAAASNQNTPASEAQKLLAKVAAAPVSTPTTVDGVMEVVKAMRVADAIELRNRLNRLLGS